MFRIDILSFLILFYRIVFGLYLLNGHVNTLFCGGLKYYNQTTHECVDGNVVPLRRLICSELQRYDPTTGKCKKYDIIDGSGKTGQQGITNDVSDETGENKTKHKLLCGDLLKYDPKTNSCKNYDIIPGITNDVSGETGENKTKHKLLCGDLLKYDPKTNSCKNYDIIPGITNDVSGETGENKTKHQLLCGDLLKYDPKTNSCKNFDIIPGITNDGSGENGETKSNDASRLRFCGQQKYEPAFETCCFVDTNKYKIYDGREKYHICCGVEVFRRGSKRATCLNASMNDKLFDARRLRTNRKICMDFTQGYRIDIKGRMETETDSYFHATLTRVWNLSSKNKIKLTKKPRNTRAKTIRIKLDKNSPKRNKIVGKSFIVYTVQNYNSLFNDSYFYISHSDKVYKIPSKRFRMMKALRKIRNSCRTWRESG